jgi:hypothetical protein
MLYQLVWNLLLQIQFDNGIEREDVFSLLLANVVLTILIYIPPRIFYFAEGYRRGWIWFAILLANAPIIFRLLNGDFGGSGIGW